MTKQRNDEHSTEFGLWLREQKEIDSSLGYVTTNIDYVWENYKTGEWMLIEEKRHNRQVGWSQGLQFAKVDKVCKTDVNYKGFYRIRFENTSPEDGEIFINDKEVNIEELIKFLKFENIAY